MTETPGKPISRRLLCNVAADVLRAARSPYPVLVDRGAHPEVPLAVLAMLIRAAGERTDCGIREILEQADRATVYGELVFTMTKFEAAVAGELVDLSRAWDVWCDPDSGPMPLERLYVRAQAWTAYHDVADALGVLSVGVQLLMFIETLQPGVLAQLADDIEVQAWADRLGDVNSVDELKRIERKPE